MTDSTAGPRRPSRRRLAGLAGPTPTGVTANDVPAPDSRTPALAPAREGAPPRAQASGQAPARASERAGKRAPGRTAGQASRRAAAPATDQAGAKALAPAAAPAAGWPYEHRRAWELRARAYAKVLERTRARGVELADAAAQALAAGAAPADLAAALRDAGLGGGDVPPDVARAAGLGEATR